MGEIFEDEIPDAQMREAVVNYVDAARGMMQDCEIWGVDTEVDLDKVYGVPNEKGTCDLWWLRRLNWDADPNGSYYRLTVVDFKYGVKKVEVHGNSQATLYALGLMDKLADYNIVELSLGIFQPRCGGMSLWSPSIEEVANFHFEVMAKVAEIQALLNGGDPTPHLVPGEEQCRYCLAKISCPAFRDSALSGIAKADDFEVIGGDAEEKKELLVELETVSVPSEMRDPGEVYARLLPKIKALKKLVKIVEKQSLLYVVNGGAIPGYKLVEGRKGNREWTDWMVVRKLLRTFRFKDADMLIVKLKSPKQIFDVVTDRQWGKLDKFVIKKPGRPTLALTGDARPALNPADQICDFSFDEDDEE
jgi:hypothetical protein